MLKHNTYASFEVPRPLTESEMQEVKDFIQTLLRTPEDWQALYAKAAETWLKYPKEDYAE